jgi:hypothetical protein
MLKYWLNYGIWLMLAVVAVIIKNDILFIGFMIIANFWAGLGHLHHDANNRERINKENKNA